MSSPYYDKVDIDLKFDQHRKILENIAKNLAKGVAATILPETSTEDINALEEGKMYHLGKAGDYQFDPPFIIVEGQIENKLPVGYDVIVTKNAGMWSVVSLIELPGYDDSAIQEKITGIIEALAKKVDAQEGKDLSTNDYDNTSKAKVDALKNTGEGKMFLSDDGTYKKAGNGSGFYNVTTKFPQTDYYTLETAIEKVSNDTNLEVEDIKGMVITFESADKVWTDYVFLGESKDGLSLVSNWETKSVRNVIKSIDLYKGVDKSTLTPDENGNVVIQIDVVQVDDTLNPGSSNAVAGGAVYAKFAELDLKFGTSLLLNTIEDGIYSLSLLNSENEVLSTTETFSGGGGGGSTVNSKVVLTKITENPTVKLGDEVKLQYTYDQVDTTTGTSTGNSATATITVSRGATSNTYTKVIGAGATDTIDVTEYLAVGTSSVRVRVQTNDELQQVSSISWQITVVQLKLESSFNIATNTVRGQSITIPYTLTGSGSKTLNLYVDGTKVDDKVITTSSSTGTFTFNSSNLVHGTHSFQLVATLEVNSTLTILSNSIYFGAIITEASKTIPVFGSRFDYTDGTIIKSNETPYIPVKRYSNYNIVYAVYDPTSSTSNVTVKVNNITVSQASVQLVRNVITARATILGTLPGVLNTKTTNYLFYVKVSPLDVDITEPTDGLKLKLTADGRTNSDVNKTEWKYESIDSTLENFTWVGNGWLNGALRHTDKAKTTVNFYPLQQGVINNNSFTFTTKIKVSDLIDAAQPLLKCLDTSGTGFVITGQEAKMVSKGGSEVTTKFATDEEYNIGFVSFPIAGPDATDYEKENSGMLYLYVNGISSGAVQRGSSDNIYQFPPSKLIIEPNSKATIDVYSMRFYDRYLTDSEMLNAFLIDLVDTETLLDKFLENNILDATGNISVESLPSYLPYMIITGAEENGVATVLQAAVNNNKNTKYNVDEILYINPLKPTLNFKATGGMIRLQGTSSLAYPIKNYRIYFYDANKNKAELRLGVDNTGAGGAIKEDSKYSFRTATSTQKAAIPVNCFCLKADYAESSSSHNTGTARIVHDVMNSVGDLTPPQKLVSKDYEYDVRTTIDGFPIALFYRKTKNDTPVFLSKFNFNNDKSTEEVFGFRDIPGYHNQPWVQSKFGGNNPTECWEFLNNDYPMGMFLDDDFDTKGSDGKPNWMKVFEARYIYDESLNVQFEAGTLKPYHLERLVKWIKSTQNNPAKFKAEVGDYFDIPNLCDYYNFTDFLAAVDQRVKNMMFAFYYDPARDKVLCYPIFYDNDTILGVRNDGKLKYSWDIDENTTDPELGTAQRPVYAFAGHDSVLWKNLRSQMQSELQASYQRLRARMSNDFLFRIYDTEQSKKFVERIYNIDALNKYVIPATVGIEVVQNGQTTTQTYDYLESLQGSRLSHRHWWLINRLGLFDARHNTGNYRLTDITWKGNSPAGAIVKATAARDFYFAFTRESTVLSHKLVKANEDFVYTYTNEANIGTIFHLYGGDWAKKLDLSNWGGFTSLSIPKLKVLEELILGNAGKEYTLPSIAIGDSLPLVKKIDITNYVGLKTLDLSGCKVLTDFNASGCTSLTNIKFNDGSPLNKVVFPVNYENVIFKGHSTLKLSNITFQGYNHISQVVIENSPMLKGIDVIDQIRMNGNTQKLYVRFDIGEVIDDGTLVSKLFNYNLGGVNATGVLQENTANISGKVIFNKWIDEAILNKWKVKFPELTLVQSKYTIIEATMNTELTAKFKNLDNNTGYGTISSYSPSGHLSKILSLRKQVMVKKVSTSSLIYYPLHPMNQTRYYDNEDLTLCTLAVTTGEHGDMYIDEPEYWYKGINDIINGKQYYVFSSTQPSTDTDSKVILYTDYSVNVQDRKILDITLPTLSESIIDDITSSIHKINVKGYKRVRVPFSNPSNNTGSLFVDSLGAIVGRKNLAQGNEFFQSDSYLIYDIPDTAEYLYFSTPRTNKDVVILTTNIADIGWVEPKWTEHQRRFISAYHVEIGDAVIRSVTGGGTDNIYQKAQTIRKNALPYVILSFKEKVSLINLFIMKYGDTEIAITGNNFASKNRGASIGWGMRDTKVSSDGVQNQIDYLVDGVVNTVNVNCPIALGYENLFSGIYPDAFTGVVASYSATEISITSDDKVYIGAKVNGYPKYLKHGKDCNPLPMTMGGSTSTYYPDLHQGASAPLTDIVLGFNGPYKGNNGVFALGTSFGNNGWNGWSSSSPRAMSENGVSFNQASSVQAFINYK